MAENLWERAREALRDMIASSTADAPAQERAFDVLAEMERVECVEGKADPSGGFWQNTDFPSDRPALLLLLPETGP